MEEIFRPIGKGLLAILPIVLLVWIFSFVYKMFAGIFFYLFGMTDNNLFATLFIVVCSFLILFYIGYLVEKNREFLLLKFTELVINRIPIVKGIYSAVKDVVKIFSGGGKDEYLGVVYVSLGSAKLIGFITKEDCGRYWVFVPTTPNPTSGLLLSFAKDEVEAADMSVSDGFKKIISLGVK
ncbi:MAG: DUF502 domain-containing protein [Wolinella sp.]